MATAIHALDMIITLMGEPECVEVRPLPGMRNTLVATMPFSGGATGIFALHPDTGTVREEYELSGTGYQLRADFIKGFFEAWIDGIIIYPSAPAEDNTVQQYYLKNIVEQNIPMVIIGRDEHINVDKVLFSDYEAGKNAALAFLAKECRCFGAVTMPECSSLDKQRIRGYVETLFQHGVKPESIIETTTNGTANEAAVRRLMPVDCLWGINTGLILNVVNAMSRFRDVTMLQLRGLGIEPFLDLLPFHITMQPMPSRQMGETAAALLLDQIGASDKLPPRTVILPWPDLPV